MSWLMSALEQDGLVALAETHVLDIARERGEFTTRDCRFENALHGVEHIVVRSF